MQPGGSYTAEFAVWFAIDYVSLVLPGYRLPLYERNGGKLVLSSGHIDLIALILSWEDFV